MKAARRMLGGPKPKLPYLQTVLADSPSHYWRLNEAAGMMTAADSGSATTLVPASVGMGVTLGNPGSSIDPLHTAAFLPGGNSNINNAIHADGSFTEMGGNALSFEVIANLTGTSNLQYNRLVALTDAGGHEWYIMGSGNTTGPGLNPSFGIYNNSYQYATPAVGTYTGFHHLVGVMTFSAITGGTLTLYIDGVQASTMNTIPNTASFPTSFAHAYVGDTYWGNPIFPGYVQDVAFYNYALTPAQVANHASA